jgi:hypothetical protein
MNGETRAPVAAAAQEKQPTDRWVRFMSRLLTLALALALAIPAVAQAAVKTGAYSGTSSGKFQEYGQLEMSTDKGKVAFRVAPGRVVKSFKITGQKIQCGAGGQEVAISIAKIKLNTSGKGNATYSDPSLGKFKVTITVTGRGTASGRVVPQNLCSESISFRAKRR